VRLRTDKRPPKLLTFRFGEGFVERHGRLNSQQLKSLGEELDILLKQQSDARQNEVFFRMTAEEIAAFDLRTQRISQIHVLLSEHDAKR
jgi:hypothetical protein